MSADAFFSVCRSLLIFNFYSIPVMVIFKIVQNLFASLFTGALLKKACPTWQ